MDIKVEIGSMPRDNMYSAEKSITIGDSTFYYWVNKKQDDPKYEELNVQPDSSMPAILNLSKDNENLKQALMSSQKAVFNANNQMESMKQMIMKLQKQQFTQQQNTGGTTNVSK